MPGEMSSTNNELPPDQDYFSSSVELPAEHEEPEAEPAVPNYYCVYQVNEEPMKLESFTDLHAMVSFIRETSLKPGFRLFVFDGERLKTTRFPAPHLILKDGERVPLFDTRVAYTADDDGFIGPPVVETKKDDRPREPNPFDPPRRLNS